MEPDPISGHVSDLISDSFMPLADSMSHLVELPPTE